MANQIPFSGASDAAGGYVLPEDQGALLTNGVLQLGGAIALAGDRRSTSARKEVFKIWLGRPTASFVGEGAAKPVTGGEFGETNMNVKKVASIVLFTDEMREDVRDGNVNVLVDSGVREAIADVIDANIIGKDSGTDIAGNFDSELVNSTQNVEYDADDADGLRRAVSSAMGLLEANGYGNQGNMGVLLGADTAQYFRDARTTVTTTGSTAVSTAPLYDSAADPLYGLQREYSTNLNGISEGIGGNKVVAIVVYKPNLHLRIRKDVTLTVSNEATVNDGSTDRHLFQENLTALRYETRLGFMVHDLNRSVVVIFNERSS